MNTYTKIVTIILVLSFIGCSSPKLTKRYSEYSARPLNNCSLEETTYICKQWDCSDGQNQAECDKCFKEQKVINSIKEKKLVTPFKAQDKFVNSKFENCDPVPNFSIWVDTPKAPASSKLNKTFSSLSPQAQAAYIEAVASKVNSSNAKDMNKALLAAIGPSSKKNVKDKSRLKFKRRIIFSLQNTSFDEADRISYMNLAMRLDYMKNYDSIEQAKFVSWDRFVSQYTDIDLGKATFTQTSKGGAELGAPLGSGTVGVSGERSEQLAEVINVRDKLIDFSGYLTPEEVQFLSQSTFGTDLTGENIVTLDIEVESNKSVFVYSIENLGNTNVKINRTEVFYPPEAKPISADVKLNYRLRYVGRGAPSILEYDDHITELYDYLTRKINIVKVEDMEFHTWEIVYNGSRLSLKQGAGKEPLKFSSYDEAKKLLDWLKNNPNNPNIGGNPIYLSPCLYNCGPISRNQIKKLEVSPCYQNELRPKDIDPWGGEVKDKC